MTPDLLLDTNVVLYLLRGEEEWVRVLEEQGKAIVGVSVITLMEVEMGLRKPSERPPIDRFFEGVVLVPLEEKIARRASQYLHRRSRSLRSPHVADAIIAATAAELGVPLLTNNPKDFRRFPGVVITR